MRSINVVTSEKNKTVCTGVCTSFFIWQSIAGGCLFKCLCWHSNYVCMCACECVCVCVCVCTLDCGRCVLNLPYSNVYTIQGVQIALFAAVCLFSWVCACVCVSVFV